MWVAALSGTFGGHSSAETGRIAPAREWVGTRKRAPAAMADALMGSLGQASVTAAYAGAPEPAAAAGTRLGLAAAGSRNGASITARSRHK